MQNAVNGNHMYSGLTRGGHLAWRIFRRLAVHYQSWAVRMLNWRCITFPVAICLGRALRRLARAIVKVYMPQFDSETTVGNNCWLTFKHPVMAGKCVCCVTLLLVYGCNSLKYIVRWPYLAVYNIN